MYLNHLLNTLESYWNIFKLGKFTFSQNLPYMYYIRPLKIDYMTTVWDIQIYISKHKYKIKENN